MIGIDRTGIRDINREYKEKLHGEVKSYTLSAKELKKYDKYTGSGIKPSGVVAQDKLVMY